MRNLILKRIQELKIIELDTDKIALIRLHYTDDELLELYEVIVSVKAERDLKRFLK